MEWVSISVDDLKVFDRKTSGGGMVETEMEGREKQRLEGDR